MKKRRIQILCLIITLCIASNIYCASTADQRALDYQITFAEILDFFVLSPLLWTCVGLLIGFLVGMRRGVSDKLFLAINVLPIAAILVYACAAILYALGVSMPWAYTVTAWCATHSPVFIFPGFLFNLSHA